MLAKNNRQASGFKLSQWSTPQKWNDTCVELFRRMAYPIQALIACP
jgi:hypothetical protein